MTEGHVLQLLKDMNVDKAADIDNFSGKSLKDGPNIVVNLSLNYVIFQWNIQFFQKIARLLN